MYEGEYPQVPYTPLRSHFASLLVVFMPPPPIHTHTLKILELYSESSISGQLAI